MPSSDTPGPLVLTQLTVEPGWIDYNGHMTESRYLFACSETTDELLRRIGADLAYVASGFSFYTAETHILHRAEARLGELITGTVQVLGADARRIHVFVTLLRGDAVLATIEQMMLHVDMQAGRTVPAPDHILANLLPLAEAHASLPRPPGAGRHVGQPRG